MKIISVVLKLLYIMDKQTGIVKVKCALLQIPVARTQQFGSSLDERKPFLQQKKKTPYALQHIDIK
jgi:hypothetical protein